MSQFILPARATDNNNNPLSGALLTFYDTGTLNPRSVYTSVALSTPHPNPVVADAGGLFPPIYTDPARTYRAILRTAGGTVIDQFDPYSPAGNAASLASLAANSGAGLVGYSPASTYPAGSLGKELGKVNDYNFGALAGGLTELWTKRAQFSGAAGGLSRVDSVKFFNQLNGTNGIAEMRGFQSGNDLYHSAGAIVADVYAGLFYNRLGLNGTLNGAVTVMRGVDMHNAIEGLGNATLAISFNASETDFLVGTGTIATNYAFRADNHGHATRTTGTVCGFICEDQTGGASIVAGFRSKIAAGTNKWSFYSGESGKSAHVGAFRFGDTTVPTEKVEVAGNVKVTGFYMVGANQVVGPRQTGCPGNATDLASVITLANFLRTLVLTHGLTS